MLRSEGLRKKLIERETRLEPTIFSADVDGNIAGAEFAQFLPATAAWRHKRVASSCNCDLDNLRPSGKYHRGDRAGFRACALGIGGVLDVAAGMNLSRFVF